jgi:hypothetical protein
MGVVDLASITQVIEWGSMATIVAFDTRITHRSMAPTLASASKSIALPFEITNFEIVVSLALRSFINGQIGLPSTPLPPQIPIYHST